MNNIIMTSELMQNTNRSGMEAFEGLPGFDQLLETRLSEAAKRNQHLKLVTLRNKKQFDKIKFEDCGTGLRTTGDAVA